MTVEPRSVLLKKSGFKLIFYGELREGKGPILFVHGAGGSGLLWEKQLAGLADKFSPIALDLPGHGTSQGNPCTGVAPYREVVRDFAESLALPSFVLCGHSMGGAIAMDYCLHYPADLKAIVLAGTGGRLRVAAEILDRFGRGERMPELSGQLYGSHAPGKMIREGEQYFFLVQPEVWYADFTACHNFDLLPDLWRIKIPTLVMCGTEDRMTPLKYSRHLADNIAGARLEIIPGAGHMLMLEKPDEVNSAVQSFLDDHGW